MTPFSISRICWDTDQWATVQPDDPEAFARLDFASGTPFGSGWQGLNLHWVSPDKPKPTFPLLHPALMVVPESARDNDFNPFDEVQYELLPCTVDGEDEWVLVNVLWCPARALDEARTTWEPDQVTGEARPARYVFNRMGRTDPFFKIWQTSDREILLNSEADPEFSAWCAKNNLTGLRFDKVFEFQG